jgi:hypothetical protein
MGAHGLAVSRLDAGADAEHVGSIGRRLHAIEPKGRDFGLAVIASGDREGDPVNVGEAIEDRGEAMGLEILVDGLVGSIGEDGELVGPAAENRLNLVDDPVDLIGVADRGGPRQDPEMIDTRGRRRGSLGKACRRLRFSSGLCAKGSRRDAATASTSAPRKASRWPRPEVLVAG